MRITCPSCAAEYDVGAALAEGRVVQCARCGHRWAPVSAQPAPTQFDPEPLEPEPPKPEPAALARPAVEVVQAPTPSRAFLAVPSDARPSLTAAAAAGRTALTLAWAGSVALIVALLATGYAFRSPIMQAWPPSTRLFAALGLG